MKTSYVIPLILLILVLVWVWIVPSKLDKYPDAQPAPIIQATALDGSKIDTSQEIGKIIIVNFWATWCPPCIDEFPDFIQAQEKFGNDILIIGITVDDEGFLDVKPFLEDHQFEMNYPIIEATPEIMANFGNPDGFPTTFFVDQQGRLIERTIGQWTFDRLDSFLSSLL